MHCLRALHSEVTPWFDSHPFSFVHPLSAGKMELHGVRFKPNALAALKLPLTVCGGSVGTLSLSVNLWKMWWNDPVVITLSDIEIVVRPLTNEGADLGAVEAERVRLWKADTVADLIAEEIREAARQLQEDGAGQPLLFCLCLLWIGLDV